MEQSDQKVCGLGGQGAEKLFNLARNHAAKCCMASGVSI
jgi:hypothetical protein